MKMTWKWVKEFVATDLTAEQAADRLLNAGIEVASVTTLAPRGLGGVVVGVIEEIARELGVHGGHRLVLCRVSTGRERFSVVSGAPNTAVGARAAFAPPGATLPGGRRVGVAKIRGVDSQGMLCSERELGLGEEHEAGLLLVDRETAPGADLVEALGLDDVVLDIEITPNRPDALSIVGIARELAALTGAGFRPPQVELREAGEPAHRLAKVRVEAPDLCRRFTARVISGVTVRPSPARMAARLRAVGLKPISNVVDVTNYVMWEIGHPLHAFDHATLADGTVVVRRAHEGERLRTLDGQERRLDPSMLLIADPKRGVGLAGVMGGENSEVTPATTRVLLEAAYFDAATTRRTARTLGLPSDAAYRFERGADIEGLVDASRRAAQLIAETADGTIAPGMIDVYPEPRPRPRVGLRLARVQRLIGTAPPRDEAKRILTSLQLPTRDRDGDLEVEVPSFRRDLTMEDDLVEEIVRVWGYDKIPTVLADRPTTLMRQPAAVTQAQVVRRALVGAGLSEVVTYAFSDPARVAELRDANDKPPLELQNPLTQDAALLRTHPLEGVLGVVATNLRRRQPDVRVFEIARTFERADGGTREPRWASVALTGTRAEASWAVPAQPVDVYDAKGIAEHVLRALGVQAEPGAGALAGFEPEVHGALVAGGRVVAEFGGVAESVRARFDIEAPVFAVAVALDAAAAVPRPSPRYAPLPRFPAVVRDMAFAIADPALPAATVEAAIRAEAGPLLASIAVFDVFRFPDGRRSIAWRLTFQAEDRTLTDEEVNAIHARLSERIAARFGITLRSA